MTKNKVIKQSSTRDLFIDEQAGVIVVSTIGKKPCVVTFDKQNAREVALAICPELEQEKIDFAVGFAEYLLQYDSIPFAFANTPTWRKKGSGVFDKLYSAQQLIELYKKHLENERNTQ